MRGPTLPSGSLVTHEPGSYRLLQNKCSSYSG